MKLRYGTPEEAGMSPQRIAQVARLAEGWVNDGIHPALVVLVARKGVIVLHEAFGTLRPEPDSPPVVRDTIFPLASLTKPITATAVMQLVEDGVLGLNRPVQDYLPEFVGEGKQDVMVHHLLTHTSGLRQVDVTAHAERRKATADIPAPPEGQHRKINEELFLGYDVPLWKAPGVEMSYCNFNYTLLGEIVRRVSGTPLAEFAAARIFAPLGMTDAHFVVPDELSERAVQRAADALFPLLGSRGHQRYPSANEGVYSTALDLAIFGQTFLNGGVYGGVRVLSPATVAEMTRNQIPGIGTELFGERHAEASWGYGLAVQSNEKRGYYRGSLHSPGGFDHGGAGGTHFWVDPVYELVGVYLSISDRLIRGRYYRWCTDLFANAVTAAVMDVEP